MPFSVSRNSSVLEQTNGGIFMPNHVNQSQSKKQRYYPLRKPDDPYSVDLIPVSEEIYQELNLSINRIRKQEQRAGRCFCPKHLLWKCAADCDVCPYHKKGEFLSLNLPRHKAMLRLGPLRSALLRAGSEATCRKKKRITWHVLSFL
jgi:hypothetical protein